MALKPKVACPACVSPLAVKMTRLIQMIFELLHVLELGKTFKARVICLAAAYPTIRVPLLLLASDLLT